MFKNLLRKASCSSSSVRAMPLALGLLFLCSMPAAQAQNGANVAARKDYAEVVRTLQAFIQREMEEKGRPGVSIAIVDDQQIVWAQGFGMADAKNHVPATAETVYRIGSVSKLFTDIGIMQLVERGKVDLDAPVSRYLPNFHPANPFGGQITLREMMAHRSGLVREPP